jgi:hypothetical protein
MALSLVGCGAPADTTVPATATLVSGPVLIDDPQDLIGTWFGFGRDGMYWRFNQNGTCQGAFVLERIDDRPNVECTFRFQGTHLVMTTVNVVEVRLCSEDTAIYEVKSLPNGNIDSWVVEDTCGPRQRTTAQEHDPVR